MTKVPLFKQFVVSVTNWVRDEFFIAWMKLVSIYVITSAILLSILSFVIYVAVKGNLITTIGVSFFNPFTQELVLTEALDALKERIILADVLMLVIVVIVGIILTHRTLAPIKKSMKQQKRFIADASHELRTPLAILKLETELLLRDKHLSAEKIHEALTAQLIEVNSIITLTNSLLSFSKQRSVAEKDDHVEMNSFIKKIVHDLEMLYVEKKITMTLHQPPHEYYQMINRVDFERIYANIIKNAYQYTPIGKSIEVSVSFKGKKTKFTVKDTGVGIDSENLHKIFEPFYQEDGARSGEGVGLGLSMVKKLVDHYGGTISIDSKKTEGTKVVIVM